MLYKNARTVEIVQAGKKKGCYENFTRVVGRMLKGDEWAYVMLGAAKRPDVGNKRRTIVKAKNRYHLQL